MARKKFVVCDGKMVLHLQPAGDGWYAVTSPVDPAIMTQAKSIEEAFVMAYDAQKCLKVSRIHLANQLRKVNNSESIENDTSTKLKRKLIPEGRVRSTNVVVTKKKTQSN